jgi:hypothetical protein
MSEFRIVSEPRGPAYEALLRYCADKGEFCSLVDLFPKSKKWQSARNAFLRQAEPHLLGVEQVDRWPLGTTEGGGIQGSAVPLWRFALAPAMVELLATTPRGLYGWTARAKLPEDLAVYKKDGSVLLGTVAHEHIGWMNLTPEEAADRRLGLVELERSRRA